MLCLKNIKPPHITRKPIPFAPNCLRTEHFRTFFVFTVLYFVSYLAIFVLHFTFLLLNSLIGNGVTWRENVARFFKCVSKIP